jgi:hypothetical protein
LMRCRLREAFRENSSVNRSSFPSIMEHRYRQGHARSTINSAGFVLKMELLPVVCLPKVNGELIFYAISSSVWFICVFGSQKKPSRKPLIWFFSHDNMIFFTCPWVLIHEEASSHAWIISHVLQQLTTS